MEELFSDEQKAGAYDSIYHTYLTTSASLATYSIEHNLVDVTSVLAPALQPFGLTGNPASTANIATLTPAAEAQIDATNKSLDAAHQKASTAMLQAITEMSARIHQLATGNSMPSRGTPITLTTVENWIATANTYLSASTSTPTTSATGNSTTSANGKKSTK